MSQYRVSDGGESEWVEADTPQEAADIYFDTYDWGETELTVPKPGESRVYTEYYRVFDQDGQVVLHGHLTEYMPDPEQAKD